MLVSAFASMIAQASGRLNASESMSGTRSHKIRGRGAKFHGTIYAAAARSKNPRYGERAKLPSDVKFLQILQSAAADPKF